MAEWPLVGREPELAALRELILGGSGGAVLLGQPGVGKTRLARELQTWAKRQGWVVDSTTSTEQLRTVPFGAFARWLEPGSTVAVDPFVSAVHRFIGSGQHRRDRRILLAVDDGHLLDPASQALLQQLCQSREVFLLVTVRANEGTGAWLTPMWKDGLLGLVEVQPLSRETFELLIEAALGGRVEDLTVARLWHVCRGNPLFLREVLLDAVDRSRLTLEAGVWHAPGGFGLASGRLIDVIAGRMSGLPDGARYGLDMLAFGGQLELELLERVVGEESVVALEESALVTVRDTRDGRWVCLAHPLYGESRRASMPVTRRRAVLRRLADELEALGAASREPVVLGRWRLEVGGGSPGLFLEAARQVEIAADLAVRVALGIDLEGGPDTGRGPSMDPPPTPNPLALALRLARASFDVGGGFDAALMVLTAASRLGDKPMTRWAVEALLDLAPDEEARAVVASHQAMSVLLLEGDRKRAEQVLDEAASELREPAAARALTLNRIRLLALDTMSAEVGGDLDELLTDPRLEPGSRGEALAFRAMLLGVQGHSTASAQFSDAATQILGSLPSRPGRMGVGHVISNKLVALLFAGRLEELDEMAGVLAGVVLPNGTPTQRAEVALCRGEGRLCRGELGRAEHEFGNAVICLSIEDQFRIRAWAHASLAYARMHRGDLVSADEALARMRGSPQLYAWLRPYSVRALAWREALGGSAASARDLLLESAEGERLAGRLAQAALLAHEAARLEFPAAAAALLRQVERGGYDGLWLPWMMRFAEGSTARDGRELDAVSRGFEALGCLVWAAEASTLAASAHASMGLRARAQAAVTRAATLVGRLGAVTTPILRRAHEPPALTSREREIVRLAAAGLPDSEIASRLVLSVRTVQTHLHNAYGKIGATGRQDLPSLIGTTAGSQPRAR